MHGRVYDMSSIHPRFHLVEELLGHCYTVETNSNYMKLSNERFDVLLQRSTSVVIDKGAGYTNVYGSIEVAHQALLGGLRAVRTK